MGFVCVQAHDSDNLNIGSDTKATESASPAIVLQCSQLLLDSQLVSQLIKLLQTGPDPLVQRDVLWVMANVCHCDWQETAVKRHQLRKQDKKKKLQHREFNLKLRPKLGDDVLRREKKNKTPENDVFTNSARPTIKETAIKNDTTKICNMRTLPCLVTNNKIKHNYKNNKNRRRKVIEIDFCGEWARSTSEPRMKRYRYSKMNRRRAAVRGKGCEEIFFGKRDLI